jgi:tetratricopeptide (TPR) repeat protein
MLADLQRFDEASEAFEDAVRQYQYANNFRTENDHDETFIPYSIGVVQLNHANMLAAQDKLEEAVAIKEQALTALRQRMEAGHEEILPNLHSAYRKMITIRRKQGKFDEMFFWIDQLILMLDAAVDDGKLEYRNDLASAYQLRCAAREEQKDFTDAEKDAIRAMRIFREIADDETDSPEIHIAKIQWGEMLEHVAVLHARQGKIDDAMHLFKNAVDDVTGLWNDGNKMIIFDILLAYTQFIGFVEMVIQSSNFTDTTIEESNLPKQILARLKKLSKINSDTEELPEGVTQHTSEEFDSWINDAVEACNTGIKLSQRQQLESKSPLMEQFFSMKVAFFQKRQGMFAALTGKYEKACEQFELAAKQWESLILGLEKLKAQNRYFAAETGISETNFPTTSSNDSFAERFLYYVGELRQTLQCWANTCIELKLFDNAEQLFHREIEMTRDLANKEISNADRFLVLSLTYCARAIEEFYPPEKMIVLYDEARQLIRKRIRSGEIVSEDYSMFRQIHLSYALFLAKTGKTDAAEKLMDDYATDIDDFRYFPEPEQWIELCNVLMIQLSWLVNPAEIENAGTRRKKLFAKHPMFNSNSQFRNKIEQFMENNDKDKKS